MTDLAKCGLPSPGTLDVKLAVVAAIAIAVSAPFVAAEFPDYLPSHLAQIAAIFTGVAYFRQYDLWGTYPAAAQRLLLVSAYIAPLANLFFPKILRKGILGFHPALELLRPEIVILLVAVAITRPRTAAPRSLLAAGIITAASVAISSAASIDPTYALACGFFEGILPFLVIFAFMDQASDRRFMWHALTLFMLAFTIVAIAQTAFVWWNDCCSITSGGFLDGKMNLPLMVAAGGNGYGNTGNFVALAVLILPFAAGSIFGCDWLRRIRALTVAIIIYALLIVYSRAGMIVATLSLIAVFIAFYRSTPRWGKYALLGIGAAALLTHVPTGGLAYFQSGVSSFVTSDNKAPPPDAKAATVLQSKLPDASGEARSEAIHRGLSIGAQHWLAGVGYGMYSRYDPELTAPHSMAVLRFAEGGALGLVGFIALILAVALSALRARFDDLDAVCLISLASFFVYAVLFGAAFSLAGLVPWGTGTAIMVACLATKESLQ